MSKKKKSASKVPPKDELALPTQAPVSLKIQINQNLYLRDPQDSRLGRSILEEGTTLMDELGIEDFTFKKLAERMGSTEASIYRYFANKHLLLVYLACFYWGWIHYRINTETQQAEAPKEKILRIIHILVDTSRAEADVDFLNMRTLFSIMVAESTKVYHTKLVDEENRQGFFLAYKALCKTIADHFLRYEPSYPYPRALASSLLEMSKDQLYFAHHLPRLTDIQLNNEDVQPVLDLLSFSVFAQLDSIALRAAR